MKEEDFAREADELESLADDAIFSLALKLCGMLEEQCVTLDEVDSVLRKTREILSLGLSKSLGRPDSLPNREGSYKH
ncbi:hypothetical protein ACFLU4_02055 [Chloroflexota bacterium]